MTSTHGLAVPVPLPTTDGRLFADGVVVTYAAGGPPETEADWRRVADTLRRLHRLTVGWPQRLGWRSSTDLLHAETGTKVDLGAMPPAGVARCRAAWARLAGPPTCVVHGNPNNPGTVRLTSEGEFDQGGLERMAASCMMVIAHRGASSYAPENTLAAFDLALEMGARHIELDVDVTSDGHVVVIHDDTIDRTTDGSGPVTSHTLAALRALDAGSWFGERFTGERIPTLHEVLERYQGRAHIHTEIKGRSPSLSQRTADAIRVHGMEEQVTITSFQSVRLEEMRAYAPELPLGYQQLFLPAAPAADLCALGGVDATSVSVRRQTPQNDHAYTSAPRQYRPVGTFSDRSRESW